jgi:hypothetical protein
MALDRRAREVRRESSRSPLLQSQRIGRLWCSEHAICWCTSVRRSSTLCAVFAEFGLIVAQGPAHVAKLILAVQDPEPAFPEAARPVLYILVDSWACWINASNCSTSQLLVALEKTK